MGRRSTTRTKTVDQKVANKNAANKKNPACREMITIAISILGENSGSSKSDILKYMKAHWDVDSKTERTLDAELRKAVKDGCIVQCTKGKSKTRLFKLFGQSKDESKPKRATSVTKRESLKKKTRVTNGGETSKPGTSGSETKSETKSETMTRGKLPIKVKEAKEKKKAAAAARAAARRAAIPKRKRGRPRSRKVYSAEEEARREKRRQEAQERRINAKIFAFFDEIWMNM